MDTASFSQTLWKGRSTRPLLLPIKTRVVSFADRLLQVLFPHFSERPLTMPDEIDDELQALSHDLAITLRPLASGIPVPVDDAVRSFFEALPEVYADLCRDASTIADGDPAAENIDEVIAAYPGFLAIAIYRIAHRFYEIGVPVFPRIMSEHSHHRTGVDIHPGARIGKSFFIDHGTGIVIGETTIIGDRVKLYQGVTLGALSVSKEFRGTKRHPTIQDNVVIYSNATILGGETVIGHDSTIGGNVWLTESVPPFSVVYHKSEINVRSIRKTDQAIDFSI